jgi:outer membrane lipoprotein LolB
VNFRGVTKTSRWSVLCFATLVLLTGCAIKTQKQPSEIDPLLHWQGKISAKVHSTPMRVFYADFDLDGSPISGTLALQAPLGIRIADMRWDSDAATLVASGKSQQFESLQSMVFYAVGVDLPVAYIFDWLEGKSTSHPNWQVDLSERANGRITAQKIAPEPKVDLKIFVEPN